MYSETKSAEDALGVSRGFPASENAGGRGRRSVIVVDDDEINRRVIITMLKKEGFTAEEDLQLMRDAGCDDIIPKPINREEL